MAAVKQIATPIRRLPPLPTISDLLKLYKLRARKQLSQNFLLDKRICDKIVKCAGNLEDYHVCEIGPGPGSITRSILAKNIAKLSVIEKDERFKPTLELLADAANPTMEILWGDILDYNLESMFPSHLKRDWVDESPKICLVGNLPFSISTPLIIRWLRQISARSGPFHFGRTKLVLTFQEEIAERLFAPPSHPQRSRLSVMAQHLCYVDFRFTIPGKAFLPPPDVNVGVVVFKPFENPRINHPYWLVEKVVTSIFQFRKKYCIRGVELLVPDPKLALSILEGAQINPEARSYELSMSDFSRICDIYYEFIQKDPNLACYDYRL